MPIEKLKKHKHFGDTEMGILIGRAIIILAMLSPLLAIVICMK
jgi:hypothetical protein